MVGGFGGEEKEMNMTMVATRDGQEETMEIIEPGQEVRQVKEPIDPIEVARLVSKGYTAQEAADEMGYSMWSVRDNARQMGLRFKDPRGFTPQQVELAVEMRRRGYSLQQIADEVGKSKAGVRKLLGRVA